ncbi:cupin domain-containing protein [Phenylobacterium sp. LjRoot219]|uniref:cupin domain-containing protein n=1 Tax=Phenylobacterium sp. LjRoot219 TaxID=3342283 RepID=UPI003ED0DC3B
MTQDQASDDLWFLNSRVRVRSRSAAGEHPASLIEHRMVRGDSPPLHLHRREDEVFHILEGEVLFQVGDQLITARTGDTVVGPKGVPHTFRIESDEARLLTFDTAGDFEGMMREVARPAGEGLPPMAEPSPAEIEALVAASARHNIEILGPPMSAR